MSLDDVPLNKYTSTILLAKVVSSMPFYIVGLMEPSWVEEYTWILFMEAFHHFHARIFFLLTLYRCLLQIYFAILSNGFYQRRFIMLEVLFDVGLMCIYVHENFRLHNIQVFYSKFLISYMTNAILSLLSLRITDRMKVEHIV
jgi:hypothetical protein